MKTNILKATLLTVSIIFFSQLNNLYASIDTIRVQNFYFSPATLVINQGDTVVWQLINGNHTATSGTMVGTTNVPDGIWDSGFLTDIFSFTFNSIGTYPYYCIPHGSGGMVGVISVLPSGQAGQIVTISNFTFSPDNLSINKDEVVTWIIMEGMHSTTSGTSCTKDGLWDSGIMDSVGQTFIHTFNTNGIYSYYCIPHCVSNDMKGLILVDTVITGKSENLTYNIESIQIYPNPFSNYAIIEYKILKKSEVTLKVYDILGNEVKTLVNKSQDAGLHRIELNASDLGIPNGMYFYHIKTDYYKKGGMMILAK